MHVSIVRAHIVYMHAYVRKRWGFIGPLEWN